MSYYVRVKIMQRVRDVGWKFWPLYKKYKDLRHGRGGWTDVYGYKEDFCLDSVYPVEGNYRWRWVQDVSK